MEEHPSTKLWNEYRQLAASFENYQSTSIKAMPIIITILAGLTIFEKINRTTYGFGIPLAISLVLILVGYCHTLLSYYGIKLVEIELKINEVSGVESDNLTFYTNYVGEGLLVLHGYIGYTAILIFIGVVGMYISIPEAYVYLKLNNYTDGSCIGIPFILFGLPLITTAILCVSEGKYRKDKRDLLLKYNTQPTVY